jgi:hypothetical protein
MRTHSPTLASVAQLLILAACTGCNSSSTVSSSTVSDASGAIAAGTVPIQLCEKDCEKAPDERYRKLPLNSKELQSLSRAVPVAKEAPVSTHLHASVVDGNINFTSDPDSTHTAGVITTLALGAHGSQPASQIKVVATPQAAALLHQRMSQPTN